MLGILRTFVRGLRPWSRGVAAALACGLLCGCISPDAEYFGRFKPKSDAILVFNNQSEPEYIDPGLMTGQPDARIASMLFEGLTVYHPEKLSPVPGVAHSWELHEDKLGYTFHLRPDARWSDGRRVTAADFAYSWERVLNPITASRYAQQLYAVRNAELYNTGRIKRIVVPEAVVLAEPPWSGLKVGASVPVGEVMLVESSNVLHVTEAVAVLVEPGLAGATLTTAERGEVLLLAGDSKELPGEDGAPVTWYPMRKLLDADPGDIGSLLDNHDTGEIRGWVPGTHVDPIIPNTNARTVASRTGLLADPDPNAEQLDTLNKGDEIFILHTDAEGRWTKVSLPRRDKSGWVESGRLADPRGSLYWLKVSSKDDFGEHSGWMRADALLATADLLGFRVVDPLTFEVRLNGPTPYFLTQTSHSTLLPVPKAIVERYGPRWTRPENIVGNGPFVMVEHRVRDRFVMRRSPTYWDAANVALDGIIAYSIDHTATSANLYRSGDTDLVVANDFPSAFIPVLRESKDLMLGPGFTVYFYRINVTRPPLDDPRVRRALNLAIDKEAIVKIKGAGEIPAVGVVPPGLGSYASPEGEAYDPVKARALLAEAGYPGGAGFPEVSVLYNTKEEHKLIAAAIQAQWREVLGIRIELENKEWKTYLKAQNSLDYDICRAGWIGDYPDANTFLDLWVTDGGNNSTGWSSLRYDELIARARVESNPRERLEILKEAEGHLMEEMPIIPMYFYVWAELRKPYVKGYYSNPMDKHPWKFVSLDLVEANRLATRGR